MPRELLTILVILATATVSTAMLQAQVIKPPKLPKRPPTINDIEREAQSAEKELNRAWDNIKNLNPAGASEESWGEAGRLAYTSASSIMEKRSPNGEALDPNLKNELRPQFDDLVDKVAIHWGTPTLDEWAAAKFKIRLTDTESEAQAYGYDIYIKWQKTEQSDVDRLLLLKHEMMHARQYERYGNSLSNFGYHYFKEYKKANLNYAKNKLEREADAASQAAHESGGDHSSTSDSLIKPIKLPDGVSKAGSNQRWRFHNTPTKGEYIVEWYDSAKDGWSNMALDNSSDGAVVLATLSKKSGTQRWQIEDAGDGCRLIVSERSKAVLDYQGKGDAKYQANVQQRAGKHGKFGQKWMILKTPSQDELGFWNPHAKQYLSFDREKNSLVCGAYAGPSAAGDGNDLSSVDVWKYGPNKLNGGGQFQRQNDEWSEFQGGAFIAKFREVERGKDQIIIHDAGRDMYLRLNVDRAWWRVGDGAWNFIYDRM